MHGSGAPGDKVQASPNAQFNPYPRKVCAWPGMDISEVVQAGKRRYCSNATQQCNVRSIAAAAPPPSAPVTRSVMLDGGGSRGWGWGGGVGCDLGGVLPRLFGGSALRSD